MSKESSVVRVCVVLCFVGIFGFCFCCLFFITEEFFC